MATILQNAEKVSEALWGSQTREPIADSFRNTTSLDKLLEDKNNAIATMNQIKSNAKVIIDRAKTQAQTDINNAKNSAITSMNADKNSLNNYKNSQLSYLSKKNQEVIASGQRVSSIEAKHATRVVSYSLRLTYEIDSVDVVERIVHDTPTLYSLTPGLSGISVSLISGVSYKLTDTTTSDSVKVLTNGAYKYVLGSNWTRTALDDPTHIEYEQITHYKNNYVLSFIRANQ